MKTISHLLLNSFAVLLFFGEIDAPAQASLSVVGEIQIEAGAATAVDTSAGDPGPILAKPGQSFSVRLALINASADQPLCVSAGMGGVIDGKKESLVRAKMGDPKVDLTFTVGTSRGRYLLELQNGRESQILEFWVGEEPPQGKPGPKRTFSAPQS